MKQCNNYEDAFFSDCHACDENCVYRKHVHFLIPAMLLGVVIIVLSIFAFMIF